MNTCQQPQDTPAKNKICIFGFPERDVFIETEYVLDGLDIAKLFPVPRAPDYTNGILPVRGKIMQVVDLSRGYSIGNSSLGESRLIVACTDGKKIGFPSVFGLISLRLTTT